MSGGSRRSRRASALIATCAALAATGGWHAARTAGAEEAAAGPSGTTPAARPVSTASPWPSADPSSTAPTFPATGPTGAPSSASARTCTPEVPPVDPDATAAARCAAETLDRWLADGATAVGQQVNISNDRWDAPLRAWRTGSPAVVGFDLDELVDAARRGQDRTEDLALLAEDGALLTASWHAHNPWTGGDSFDRTGAERLAELLDPTTPAARRFAADWAEALALLAPLQERGVAVVLRPLHEAGGGWFWWGRPDPTTYRALFAQLQQQAADAGLHHLLWSYGAAVRTWEGVDEPRSLLPDAVDLVGLDTYDCESVHPDCGGRGSEELAVDEVDLTGYAELAAAAPRAALTEVGPAHSPDGDWDPAVITSTLRTQGLSAAYALLWFDDAAGRKQVSSLRGGRAWLDSCPGGVCSVR
ncbi:MAG: glycosyl hydrolase [Nocardioides sp.]